MYQRKEIPQLEIQRQTGIMSILAERNAGRGLLAFVDTYGCQQNEADSQRIRGILEACGYGFTKNEAEADVIVINTCAVREHAEMRVLGNVGALVHTKRAKPDQIIIICGCMMQEKHMADKIKNSFRHVDLVFGTGNQWRLPEYLLRLYTEKGRIFAVDEPAPEVAEGLPMKREGGIKAWLSVMYGCNNFCSYCVVPYVRGRERSRSLGAIKDEAQALIAAGYKDITLLGQNVNSYGKDLPGNLDFAELLRQLNSFDGEFLLRFMTSHPKDASEKLFAAMAGCEKVAKHIHLPFQAGNDRVLREMNRGYTAEGYLKLVDMARKYMPDIVLTSDVIVGFPGETDAEFEDTLELIKTVGYDALFTFIFSPRVGTKAAAMPDPFTREEKQRRFDKLVTLQNEISAQKHAAMVGKTLRVLVDGRAENDGDYPLTSRTNGGRLVHLKAPESSIGSYMDVKITGSNTWALYGEKAD